MDRGTRRKTHVSGCKVPLSLPYTSLHQLWSQGVTRADSEAGPWHVWPRALAFKLE